MNTLKRLCPLLTQSRTPLCSFIFFVDSTLHYNSMKLQFTLAESFTYLATCRFTNELVPSSIPNELVPSSIPHKDVNILIQLIYFNDAFSSRQK